MRPFLLSCFLTLLLPLSAVGAETVRGGIYQNKPGVFIDAAGKVQGFYIEVLEEAAEREGRPLEFVPGPWSDNLANLESGATDLQTDIVKNDKRATFGLSLI